MAELCISLVRPFHSVLLEGHTDQYTIRVNYTTRSCSVRMYWESFPVDFIHPYIHDSSRGSYTFDLSKTSFDDAFIVLHGTRECLPVNAGEEGDFP